MRASSEFLLSSFIPSFLLPPFRAPYPKYFICTSKDVYSWSTTTTLRLRSIISSNAQIHPYRTPVVLLRSMPSLWLSAEWDSTWRSSEESLVDECWPHRASWTHNNTCKYINKPDEFLVSLANCYQLVDKIPQISNKFVTQ